jgi:hypothetical protein
MGGFKFRALAPVSPAPVSSPAPAGKTILPPRPKKRQRAKQLERYIVEDRPNGPGTLPFDEHLHFCIGGQHLCLRKSFPVDEPESEPPFISCHSQGPCSGIDDNHSPEEFSESDLSARERIALKKEVYAHSPSFRKLVDLFVQVFKK